MPDAVPLFTALIDDAALFPPGSAAMGDALAAHPHHHRSPYADVVGRFLCPASRLDELTEVLAENQELTLGVIADGPAEDAPLRLQRALAAAAADHRLTVETVEIRPADGADVTGSVETLLAVVPPLPTYVELPTGPGWTGGLDAVAAAGRGAKLRTGGAATPTVEQVAAFVLACVERDVPFKCTAGLHHAVRQRDEESGQVQHGFLNVALATHAAVLGESAATVEAVLAEQSPDALLVAYAQVTEHDARRTRGAFVAFGSCSVLQPVTELTELGLL